MDGFLAEILNTITITEKGVNVLIGMVKITYACGIAEPWGFNPPLRIVSHRGTMEDLKRRIVFVLSLMVRHTRTWTVRRRAQTAVHALPESDGSRGSPQDPRSMAAPSGKRPAFGARPISDEG